MGCKRGVFLTAIPKALEEGAQSGKSLIISAGKLIPREKRPINPKKPFTEALSCLLDVGMIQIESYSIFLDGRSRPQSFNPDGFIFSLVKTEPLDILFLINNVEKGGSGSKDDFHELRKLFCEKGHDIDPKDQLKWESFLNFAFERKQPEGKKAFYELRKLFCKKVLEIESENQQKWDSLLNNVILREPSEDEILWYHAKQKINEELLVAEHYGNEIGYKSGEIEEMILARINDSRNDLPQIIKKHDETSLYLLEIPENLELNEYELQLKAMDPKPESITKNHLFTNKKFTKEEFLTKIGFKAPINHSHNTIDELFQDVFSYINSQEKGRDELVERFARGLSDRYNSNKFLNGLVNEVKGKDETLIYDYSI